MPLHRARGRGREEGSASGTSLSESSQGWGSWGAGLCLLQTHVRLPHHIGMATEQAPGSEDTLAWSLAARSRVSPSTYPSLRSPKGETSLTDTRASISVLPGGTADQARQGESSTLSFPRSKGLLHFSRETQPCPPQPHRQASPSSPSP